MKVRVVSWGWEGVRRTRVGLQYRSAGERGEESECEKHLEILKKKNTLLFDRHTRENGRECTTGKHTNHIQSHERGCV